MAGSPERQARPLLGATGKMVAAGTKHPPPPARFLSCNADPACDTAQHTLWERGSENQRQDGLWALLL